MKFGLQNSVIGWDDPFYPNSKTLLRTGEGQPFPSQDTAPTVEAWLSVLHELGLDFVMQDLPDDGDFLHMFDRIEQSGLEWILGNELGCINGPYVPGTNRYDFPAEVLEAAKKHRGFLGVLYDETEHLQLHPMQYKKDVRSFQWVNEEGQTAEQAEEQFVSAVRSVIRRNGCPMFTEHVFPSLVPLFARAGAIPCPKTLKEEFQSIQLAIAMGAAREYGTELAICADLWGLDVGPWFTRLWGFPAHSPREFESALEMSYRMGVDYLFVENADPLMVSRGTHFELTEFGEIYKRFVKRAKRERLGYSHRDVTCRVAVVHAEDGIFSVSGTFDGAGAFGFRHLPVTEGMSDLIRVMNILAHRTASELSLNQWKSELAHFPTGAFVRNGENLKTLPLKEGVPEESRVHPLFYPMDGVLVFDDKVGYECLADVEAVVVCGSRLSEKARATLNRAAREGKKVIVSRALSFGIEGASVVENFIDGSFEREIAPHLGREDEWIVRFGKKMLVITNPSGDGITLNFAYREV